ncbi:MAG: hemerythrin domain-containing protein [Burkholderiales bacterium]
METIRGYLGADHARCDEAFAQAEAAVAGGDWERAAAHFAGFHAAMARHLAMEEEVLFPAFEAATGNSSGPSRVMRAEHEDMRELLAAMGEALARRDREAYAGAAETLLVLMEQHNLKEEQILYPMCDRLLARESADLLARMQAMG